MSTVNSSCQVHNSIFYNCFLCNCCTDPTSLAFLPTCHMIWIAWLSEEIIEVCQLVDLSSSSGILAVQICPPFHSGMIRSVMSTDHGGMSCIVSKYRAGICHLYIRSGICRSTHPIGACPTLDHIVRCSSLQGMERLALLSEVPFRVVERLLEASVLGQNFVTRTGCADRRTSC